MPGNQSKVWALDAWTVNVASQTIDHGRGEEDGEFLRIEKPTKNFGYKGSGSGEGTFFRRNSTLVQVTIVLPQGSAGNDVLNAIYLAQLLADAAFPIAIGDRYGNSKLASDAAMIEEQPDETVSVEPGTLEWVLLVHDPLRQVGGH